MTIETFDPKQNVINVTERAQTHFENTVRNASAIGVRLSLTGGGCAGFAYKWDLVKDMSEVRLQEFSIEYPEWTFWLDTQSQPYLVGSTIELQSGVAGQFVEIQAPLASSACGCGESVSFSI
jgi:iron-sulfur cluster assembly protein